MSISDNQKLDFLWKKLGYGATKTDINASDYESLIKILNFKTRPDGRHSFLVYYQDKLVPLTVNSISYFFKKNQTTYAITSKNKTYVIDQIGIPAKKMK